MFDVSGLHTQQLVRTRKISSQKQKPEGIISKWKFAFANSNLLFKDSDFISSLASKLPLIKEASKQLALETEFSSIKKRN